MNVKVCIQEITLKNYKIDNITVVLLFLKLMVHAIVLRFIHSET